jgi:hypothetical protein
MVLALFILFCSVRSIAVIIIINTTHVFRVVVGTSGTLTHLIAQRCASDATYNGTNRPQKGTYGSACNTTAHGSYCFTSINTSRIGFVATSSTVPIAVVVISHPSHSFDL